MGYSFASEDATEFARLQIVAGYRAPDEIRDSIGDYFENEENRNAALEALPQQLLAHANEMKSWPRETDCDRLDAAFADLEARGIIARQNYACCNRCGHEEIQKLLLRERAKDREARGYVFFHMQDTDHAVAGGALHLRFGTLDRETEADIEVGRAVVAALREHELSSAWTGDPNTTITLDAITWQRRRPPCIERATPEAALRRMLGALSGLVCADFVTKTHVIGEAWVWLGEDARALAWASSPVGGGRSAVADAANAGALATVAGALALRGDRERVNDLWARAFAVAPSSAPSTLLELVSKAPLSEVEVFEAARARAMRTEPDASGGAIVAWFALRAESLPHEERSRLAGAAAAIFERNQPPEWGEGALAHGALACALVALAKRGLLADAPSLAVEVADGMRVPKFGEPALREELAARALDPDKASPAEPDNAFGFACRAYAALVRSGRPTPGVRADFDRAQERWTEFSTLYEEGLFTNAERDSVSASFAVLHAAFGERADAIAHMRGLAESVRAELDDRLAPTTRALADVAGGAPPALALVSAMPATSIAKTVLERARATWAGAKDRGELMKVRRQAGVLVAEARALFAGGDENGASKLVDFVLAKVSPGGFPYSLLVPELTYTMSALGRAREAAAFVSNEVGTPSNLAAHAVALLALGDREDARARMVESSDAALHLSDVIDTAVALVSVTDDPRAASAAFVDALVSARAAFASHVPT